MDFFLLNMRPPPRLTLTYTLIPDAARFGSRPASPAKALDLHQPRHRRLGAATALRCAVREHPATSGSGHRLIVQVAAPAKHSRSLHRRRHPKTSSEHDDQLATSELVFDAVGQA